MAKYNQVYGVVSAAANQALGRTDISIIDNTGLFAVGNTILNSSSTRDAWLHAICDVFAGTTIVNRAYSPKTKGLAQDSFEYGAAIREIYTYMMDPEVNKNYEVGPENAPIKILDGYHNPPKVKVQIFQSFDTYRFSVSVTNEAIKTAFTSAEEMGSFLASIMQSLENSVNYSIQKLTDLCIANFIGEKLLCQIRVGKIQAINLLAEYNALVSQAEQITDEEDILNSESFARISGRIMKNYIDKMEEMSVLFNGEDFTRFTPKDELRLLVINDFANAYDTNLQSSTFHNELTKLPGYDTVNYWQAMGKTFKECSTIHLNVASDGTEVKQSYVLALAFDKNCLGIQYSHQRSDILYDPEVAMTKYYESITKGFYNKVGWNAIVFYAATSENDYVASGLDLDSVEAAPVAQNETILNVPVSKLQANNVVVKNNQITGTLKKYEGWESGPLAGEGYFMALEFDSDDWAQYDSIKVGLDQSESTGLVDIKNDPNKNGVFKITDKDEQKFRIVAKKGSVVNEEVFSLNGLTLK